MARLEVSCVSLSQQVAAAIQDWIIGHSMEPGLALPPERKLCDDFGVSRTVMREALRILTERGIVSIQPGRGTFVSRISTQALSDSVNLFLQFSNESQEDLLTVRELLEVKIAELAARRAASHDLSRLEAAVVAMESAGNDEQQFMAGDLVFHSALAEATHSAVLVALADSIVGFLHQVRLVGFRVNAAERGRVDHRLIFEAVRCGDPVAAAAAMREHLSHVSRDLELNRGLDEDASADSSAPCG